MYANGYLTKNECTKMKAKLLKISNTTGMCDDVIVKKELIKKKKEVKIKKTEIKADDNEVGNWVAVVEHVKKKLIYTSDNDPKINTKQKAINNATSKCWFDWKHKEGDWPSENCQIISVKNTDKKSTFITKKSKKDKKKRKRAYKKINYKKKEKFRR